jgi:hypothetical protein
MIESIAAALERSMMNYMGTFGESRMHVKGVRANLYLYTVIPHFFHNSVTILNKDAK